MVASDEEQDERGAIALGLRAETRARAVLLMARLVSATSDDFCIVSNISPNGACVESTQPLTGHDTVALDFGNLLRIEGRLRWVTGQRAGIVFDRPIDLTPLFVRSAARACGNNERADGGAPDTRRGYPRVRRCAHLRVHHQGATCSGELYDVSPSGLRMEIEGANLKPGDWISVELPVIGERAASVRWTTDGRVGAAFDSPLPLWVLDRWLTAETDKCLRCTLPDCSSPSFNLSLGREGSEHADNA